MYIYIGNHYPYSILLLLALHPNLFAPGAGRNISIKYQLSDLHHHSNCFNMFMQLALPAEGYYEHMSLDFLVKTINEYVKYEEYAVTRKRWWLNYNRRRYRTVNQALEEFVNEMIKAVNDGKNE